MTEAALILGVVNLVLLLVLWIKTHYMTKMLFLIGEQLGWNDEKGQPL